MSTLRSRLLRVAADLPQGDPTRREILAVLREAGEHPLVRKVQKMTPKERLEAEPRLLSQYVDAQFEAPVNALVGKVAREIAKTINSQARSLDIKYIDTFTGELKPNPYKAQGFLERTIPALTRRLEDMV